MRARTMTQKRVHATMEVVVDTMMVMTTAMVMTMRREKTTRNRNENNETKTKAKQLAERKRNRNEYFAFLRFTRSTAVSIRLVLPT